MARSRPQRLLGYSRNTSWRSAVSYVRAERIARGLTPWYLGFTHITSKSQSTDSHQHRHAPSQRDPVALRNTRTQSPQYLFLDQRSCTRHLCGNYVYGNQPFSVGSKRVNRPQSNCYIPTAPSRRNTSKNACRRPVGLCAREGPADARLGCNDRSNSRS